MPDDGRVRHRPAAGAAAARAPPPVYAWLATQPELVTLELPTPPPNALPLVDPFYMYASTWHWQPLVNGYSGHYSARYLDLIETLARCRSRSDRRADAMGVQRILVHGGLFRPGRYPPLIAGMENHPMFHLEAVSVDHLGEVRVYAFLPGFGTRESSQLAARLRGLRGRRSADRIAAIVDPSMLPPLRTTPMR